MEKKALPTPEDDHDFSRGMDSDYDPAEQIRLVIEEKTEHDNPPRRGIAESLADVMREEMRRGFIGIPPEHQIPPV
jgi:hypothetical protein